MSDLSMILHVLAQRAFAITTIRANGEPVYDSLLIVEREAMRDDWMCTRDLPDWIDANNDTFGRDGWTALLSLGVGETLMLRDDAHPTYEIRRVR